MREIVLDTETTGFEPSEGDRIVEIGAIELLNHMPTGRTYHQYINPKRSMPEGAFGIHGIGPDLLEPPKDPKPGQVTLRDKPIFSDIAQAFVDFVGDAKLVIHNAAFDMKFLNAELGWVQRKPLPMDQALDTLMMARKKFPGSPASLDALCRRFGIDNSNRTLHGALLDSEILAEVYLELIGGRQPDLVMAGQTEVKVNTVENTDWRAQPRPTPLPPKIKAAEVDAHAAFIKTLGDAPLWNKT
ncbi:DNA polymerase III subunit epsilon [Octadecabacter sp.]|nr:DNA polymerase III subunit epsilon [Octadecabacter sp.]